MSIRAALVALLESVPDIGQVHAYERFSGTEKGFLALYAANARVRGWRVSRVSVRRQALASGRVLVTERWAIVGLLSLVDAEQSEIVAGDLADAVIAAERADPTLGGAARGTPVDGTSGMQLLALEPVMFAGVLCHRVTLQLDVQNYEGAAIAGLLEAVDGAAGRLIGAVVARLQEAVPAGLFAVIEGRPTVDPEDDPAALPAAIVTPVEDLSTPEPHIFGVRQSVDRAVAVTVVAPAGYSVGHGALAAGGLEALRTAARDALVGWGDGAGIVDVPLLYAGGMPIPSAPGTVAWRDLYQPSIYLEVLT